MNKRLSTQGKTLKKRTNPFKLIDINLDEELRINLANGALVVLNRLRVDWDYSDIGIPPCKEACYVYRIFMNNQVIEINTVAATSRGIRFCEDYLNKYGILNVRKVATKFNKNRKTLRSAMSTANINNKMGMPKNSMQQGQRTETPTIWSNNQECVSSWLIENVNSSTPRVAGIYIIQNRENGRTYVGQSVDI